MFSSKFILQTKIFRNCSFTSFSFVKNNMLYFLSQAYALNAHQRNENFINLRFLSTVPSKIKVTNLPNPPKKKLIRKQTKGEIPGYWSVTAFSTADEYDLEALEKGIVGKDLYELIPFDSTIQKDQISLQVIAKYQVGAEPRFIFFFQEGSLVAWNVSDLELENLLDFLKQYEVKPYDKITVLNEKESMYYSYGTTNKTNQLKRDSICLIENSPEDILNKYTISNAMALSVKLGIWESALEKYVDSIEYITEDLKNGKKIAISRQEVLKKTGQLFSMKHCINLSSDLLDTPDFYWERDDLENLYLQTCNYFSIPRRTKVMNEKLSHCLELVDLLSSHLSDKHHVRLEWMIIVLIMIEVGFEALHYGHMLFELFTFSEYVLPHAIKPV